MKIRYNKEFAYIEIPDDDYSLMLDADYEMCLAEIPDHKKNEVTRYINEKAM